MNETLSASALAIVLEKVCLDMETACDELIEIDARCGDGDLGITVRLGFESVRKGLPGLAGQDAGMPLARSGMAFNSAAASTFGTLLAQVYSGRQSRDGQARSVFGRFGRDDRRRRTRYLERGKAAPGERTMLDALVPAQEALAARCKAGSSISEALASAAEAAAAGAAATAQMKAKHGRAAWMAERSEGQPDAGAAAIAMLLASFAKHVGGD